ncbi:unnamed protein product [Laminaria digitata]
MPLVFVGNPPKNKPSNPVLKPLCALGGSGTQTFQRRFEVPLFVGNPPKTSLPTPVSNPFCLLALVAAVSAVAAVAGCGREGLRWGWWLWSGRSRIFARWRGWRCRQLWQAVFFLCS